MIATIETIFKQNYEIAIVLSRWICYKVLIQSIYIKIDGFTHIKF